MSLQQVSTASSPSESSKDSLPSPPKTGLFAYFARFRFESETEADERTWLSDIELIHHYTSNEHQTIYCPCHHAVRAMQYVMPREGLTHPFLLHQILALSALHLAYLRPDTRHKYLIQASQHQGVAITAMNSMLTAPCEPPERQALLGSSVFVAVSAFGTYPSCDRYNSAFDPVKSLVEIFLLIQGMNLVLSANSEADIKEGPMREIMIGCDCKPESPSKTLEAMLPQLQKLLLLLKDETPTIDEVKRQVLTDAALSLTACVDRGIKSQRLLVNAEQTVIFTWPRALPTAYHDMLRSRDPLALAIASHVCVLMHSLRTMYWFFQGWPEALMGAVVDRVAGTPWEDIIQWPIKTIKDLDKAAEMHESMGELSMKT
ncbi:hypothetical protein F66182_6403 [Fusarium sp. NRRL 66182]|nr:hypothetical protein F66182_6403 [Fusarium sp. NRRL 66182]